MNTYSHAGFFDFESLELYKKSLDYTDFVYGVLSLFPKNETYALADQWKRASVSVSLNIAEGYGETIPLALKYLKTVRGSIRECLGCSTIAYRRKYINEQNYNESRDSLIELSKLAAGYKRYLQNKLNN